MNEALIPIASAPTQARALKFWPIYLSVLVSFVSRGIGIASLTFWADELGANEFEIGLLGGAVHLSQLLGNPIIGYLSERVGRRPLILGCLFMLGATTVAQGLVSHVHALIALHFFEGLFLATTVLAQASALSVYPLKDLARVSARISGMMGCGYILGPVVPLVLSLLLSPRLALRGAFVCGGLLNLLCFVLCLFVLPETLHYRDPVLPVPEKAEETRRDNHPLRWQGLLIFILVTMARAGISFSNEIFEDFGPLFVEERLGWHLAQVSIMTCLIGVVFCVSDMWLFDRLHRYARLETIALFGGLTFGSLLCVIPEVKESWHMALVVFIQTVGFGLNEPAYMSLLAECARVYELSPGVAMALSQAAEGAGNALGPMTAHWVYNMSATHMWYYAALFTLLPLPVFALLRTKHSLLSQQHDDPLTEKIEEVHQCCDTLVSVNNESSKALLV